MKRVTDEEKREKWNAYYRDYYKRVLKQKRAKNKLSPEKRSALCRKAAMARWHKDDKEG